MNKLKRRDHHRADGITAVIAAMLAVSAFAGPTQAQTGAAASPGATSSGQTGSGPSTTAAPSTAPNSATSPPSTAPNGTAAPTTTSPNGVSAPSSTQSNANAERRGAAPPGPSIAPSPDTAAVNPTAAPIHYDMDRTIRDALDASADLANALRNVQIDRDRSDEAKAAGRPHVGAEGQATRYDQATKVSFAGGTPIQVLGNHSELLAINASDNIDLTGQIHAASTQAQLQSLEDRLVAQQIANRRILNARTVYYNLLRAQHRVSVAQASLANAQAQQKIALQLNQQQVGQKIDVYRANTQVANAQQQLTVAQNGLGIARQNFNDLVGQPVDTPVAVDDIPGVTVGESITSATQVGAPAPNIQLYTVPQSELQSIDLPRTIDQAYTQRPEVLAAELEVRVQQTGIKIARSGLEPTLTLAAGGDYYPTTSFQTPRQRTAAISATLNIPLYDGGATRDRVNEAKLRTANAETTLSSRKSDVSLDVGQAYLNLITAASQIDAANTALQQAVAARQLAQIRYEGQVGLYLEVTDAEAALVAAENNQVNAVYDYFVAKAQYENALGTPQIPAGANYPAATH